MEGTGAPSGGLPVAGSLARTQLVQGDPPELLNPALTQPFNPIGRQSEAIEFVPVAQQKGADAGGLNGEQGGILSPEILDVAGIPEEHGRPSAIEESAVAHGAHHPQGFIRAAMAARQLLQLTQGKLAFPIQQGTKGCHHSE